MQVEDGDGLKDERTVLNCCEIDVGRLLKWMCKRDVETIFCNHPLMYVALPYFLRQHFYTFITHLYFLREQVYNNNVSIMYVH